LSFAISKGTPAVFNVRMTHSGYFRTKPDGKWFTIRGRQYFTVGHPGFVWSARVWPLPFIWIDARDKLLKEEANMLVTLLSTVSIADARGAEITQGSQLRWMAEIAWFPYALVSREIAWEAIDDSSARATLLYAYLPASVVFQIDGEGKLSRIVAQRYRDLGGGKSVLTPWIGEYGNYREFRGFRIPCSVEVKWQLEDGPFSYARFEIDTIEYNVTR
jgi:hypothetical protein